MAKTVYLCGHGAWKPNDGFFNLPKGCTMSFIVHHSKCLYTTDMFRVCAGTWPNPPVDTIPEFKSCPNMTWSVDEAWKKRKCEDDLGLNPNHGSGNPAVSIFPGRTKTLKEFFEDSARFIRSDVALHGRIDFIWNCCTALGLRATEQGGKIGINAAEAHNQFDLIDFTGANPKFIGSRKK